MALSELVHYYVCKAKIYLCSEFAEKKIDQPSSKRGCNPLADDKIFVAKTIFFFLYLMPNPHSSVGRAQNLRTGSRWVDPHSQSIFFPRTDENHCDRIHSFLTAVHCFENGYVGKQPLAWKENCAQY